MSEVLIGRSGITQDGQIRINRKSDFPLTLKLMKDGSFIKWYDCDFDIRAFVEDGFTTYTAGRSEGVFNHCRIEEDGTLTLFFDNHKLPIGELQLEVIFHHPDNDYGTDRIRQEAFTIASNILLVNDNGNALSLSMPEPKVVEVEVSRKENVNVFNVLGFDGFVESTSNLETETAIDNYTILFDKQNKRFVALHEGIYSANWHIQNLDRTDEIYQTQGENVQPYANKIYINKIDGIIYYWDGSNLSPLRVKAEENGVTHFTEALNEAKKNLEELITSKNEETKGLVTTLQTQLNTLVGANASEAIESFNEVIKFLGSVRDSDTLNALLTNINERLNTLETTKVSGVNSTIETLRNSISTEASTRENAVNTINTAITELKNKKVIAEDVTTTENGDTKELTLQAGKVYMLSENVDKLRIKAIGPPENTKEVAEVMLYFHTGQNGDSGIVARSGDAPMISFEGVALPKDMTIEKNMFYEVSFKYNPIARKYTALVASWAIA